MLIQDCSCGDMNVCVREREGEREKERGAVLIQDCSCGGVNAMPQTLNPKP